jgi:hypothetical protein
MYLTKIEKRGENGIDKYKDGTVRKYERCGLADIMCIL